MEHSNLRKFIFRHKRYLQVIFILCTASIALATAQNHFPSGIITSILDVDNVRLDGNTVSTTNSNGDLTFDMNGTGHVILTDLSGSSALYLDSSKKINSATGSQYQPFVMGASVPSFAALNLAQSAAVTGVLPNANTTATSSNTVSTIVSRDGSGNFSAGTITAALSGNSSTSTALASNPTDCSANTYATTIDAGGNLTCASITNASTTGVSTNTASTLVLRDGSGNFSAGTITAALTGNSSTATALAADPADCASNTYANAINASGTLTCASITNASTTAVSTATNSTIVLRDGSANFSAGTITASLTGTASGNTTYSANNHGVVISSGTNAMTVIAPDASTTKVLTSGGASADPSWQTVTSSGSGGGATVIWEEVDNAASKSIANSMAIYSFDSGLAQNLYSSIKVPAGYSAGTQIKLKCGIYSGDSSGTFLMQTVSTLLTNNSSLVTSTTNQQTSTNSAITASGTNQNKIQTVAFDLTDGSGQINSVAVAANDTIKIQITRGTDTATGTINFLYKQCEVTNP